MARTCEERLRDVESQPPLKDLIERLAQWCALSDRPSLRTPPKAACCTSTDRGCSNNECGSYDKGRNAICLCFGPGCNSTDEFLKRNTTEEYWHALQYCLENIHTNNPHPKPVMDCEKLKVEVPNPFHPGQTATFRCCGLNARPSGFGPSSWCDEINAKCNNPSDTEDHRLKKDTCNSFCDGGYTADETEKKCCHATCENYFDACCKWFTWPLDPPPANPTPPKQDGNSQTESGTTDGGSTVVPW